MDIPSQPAGLRLELFGGLRRALVHFGIFAWLYNMLLGTTTTLKS